MVKLSWLMCALIVALLSCVALEEETRHPGVHRRQRRHHHRHRRHPKNHHHPFHMRKKRSNPKLQRIEGNATEIELTLDTSLETTMKFVENGSALPLNSSIITSSTTENEMSFTISDKNGSMGSLLTVDMENVTLVMNISSTTGISEDLVMERISEPLNDSVSQWTISTGNYTRSKAPLLHSPKKGTTGNYSSTISTSGMASVNYSSNNNESTSTLVYSSTSSSLEEKSSLEDLSKLFGVIDTVNGGENGSEVPGTVQIRKKRSTLKTSKVGKGTLQDMQGPSILGDEEDTLDMDNLVPHIRVKRDKLENEYASLNDNLAINNLADKSSLQVRVRDTYLDDLADSFPRSKDGVTSSEVGSKSKRLDDISERIEEKKKVCGRKVEDHAANLKDELDIHPSRLSNMECDEHIRKSRDNSRVYPESLSIDEVNNVSSNEENEENQGKRVVSELSSRNDEDLIPYIGDNEIIESMLSKVDYENPEQSYVSNQGSASYRKTSKRDSDRIENELRSSDESSRNLNQIVEDIRNLKRVLSKVEEGSGLSEEEKSLLRRYRNVHEESPLNDKDRYKRRLISGGRRSNVGSRRKIIISKRHKERKSGPSKHKRHLRNNQASRSLAEENRRQRKVDDLEVVGDLHVESKMEKRDSSDGRSEVDIARRDLGRTMKQARNERSPENSEDEQEVISPHDGRPRREVENDEDDGEEKKDGDPESSLKDPKLADNSLPRAAAALRSAIHGGGPPSSGDSRVSSDKPGFRRVKRYHEETHPSQSTSDQEFKFYEDVREPESTLSQHREHHPSLVEEGRFLRGDRASRSVEEIKELVEKLVAKVDELQNYISGGHADRREKKGRSNGGTSRSNITEDNSRLAENRNDSSGIIEAVKVDPGSREEMAIDHPGKEKSKKVEVDRPIQTRPARTLEGRKPRRRRRGRRKFHRKWDKWTDWSSCSVTCGKGRQIRWRHCIHDCTVAETEMEEKTCQLPACAPGRFLGLF
ncbi:uncharacterized protein LOC105699042 [Orussus abietinus]|uniref:uncharacterized protein LOC105699042 n=1 Tax=Orussus abietinus TaxID=222816 RepID=UPI000626DE5C|nr:uncharacterized protein LOC105699042 [Orussus abietinus]